MKLYILLICCETWLGIWKFSIKTCWSSHCRLCELQDIGVDMETDIGEVLLPTESWDVTAYLPEGREQRNHNVTLILQCYFHYLKKKNLSCFYLLNYTYLYITLLPEHQNNATSLQFFLFSYICIWIQNVHGYSYYAVVPLMLRCVNMSLSHFVTTFTTFTVGIQYFK